MKKVSLIFLFAAGLISLHTAAAQEKNSLLPGNVTHSEFENSFRDKSYDRIGLEYMNFDSVKIKSIKYAAKFPFVPEKKLARVIELSAVLNGDSVELRCTLNYIKKPYERLFTHLCWKWSESYKTWTMINGMEIVHLYKLP